MQSSSTSTTQGLNFTIKSSDGDYSVHRTAKTEDKQLNRSYNLFTGRKRTTSQQLWQWRQIPFGDAESWSISETNGDIIGHHGVMALEFSTFGKIVSVGKTENTFIHKEHGKKLFYPSIEKKLLHSMRERFDYLFTTASTAGRGAVKMIRQRLGYKVVGETVAYALHFNSATLMQLVKIRYKSSLLAIASRLFYPVIHTVSTFPSRILAKNVTIASCNWNQLPEVEIFWKDNAEYYGFSPHRTEQYLQWRYVDNPHKKHQLLRITQDDCTIGFAITKKYEFTITGKRFSGIMIDDIFVKKNTAQNFRLCCSVLERLYHSEAMILLPTLRQDDAINRGAQSFLGIISDLHTQKGPELLIWSEKDEIPIVYLTNIFSEGTAYELEYSI